TCSTAPSCSPTSTARRQASASWPRLAKTPRCARTTSTTRRLASCTVAPVTWRAPVSTSKRPGKRPRRPPTAPSSTVAWRNARDPVILVHGGGGVAVNAAVAQVDHAVAEFQHAVVVRDNQHGPALTHGQRAQQLHHKPAGRLIERRGRLVADDQ